MQGISKSEFARRVGLSRGRIGQMIRAQILFKSVFPDGSIDEIKGKREIFKNRDPNKRLEYETRIEGSKPSGVHIENYEVVKPFVEKIGSKKFLIRVGTNMRVYQEGNRIEVAFFPGEGGEKKR